MLKFVCLFAIFWWHYLIMIFWRSLKLVICLFWPPIINHNRFTQHLLVKDDKRYTSLNPSIYAENAQTFPFLQNDLQMLKYDAIIHVGDFADDKNTNNGKVGDCFMQKKNGTNCGKLSVHVCFFFNFQQFFSLQSPDSICLEIWTIMCTVSIWVPFILLHFQRKYILIQIAQEQHIVAKSIGLT